MPDSPAQPRRLTDADLQPLRDALAAVAATEDADTERNAVRALWRVASDLLVRTPPEGEEAAAQDALVDEALGQFDAQMAVSTAVADALDAGGGRLVTSAVKVAGANGHVVQIGRAIVSAMGPGGEKIIDALAELATSIRDEDLS